MDVNQKLDSTHEHKGLARSGTSQQNSIPSIKTSGFALLRPQTLIPSQFNSADESIA